MSVSFTWNEKTIKNEEIWDVFLSIDLEEIPKEEIEKMEEKYEYVEDFIQDKLNNTKLENIDKDYYFEEVDDNLFFVSLSKITGEGGDGYYPKNKEELDIIIKAYKEIYKVLGQYVKVTVSCNLYEDCTTMNFTLEEFLERFKVD